VGLPTPEGFTVTTEGYRLVVGDAGLGPLIQLVHGGLLPGGEAGGEPGSLAGRIRAAPVAERLASEILAAYDRLAARRDAPPLVAVRSSAVGEDGSVSFAGQFATVLGVSRDGLLEAYRQVVASLYSPEAVSYRAMHGLGGDSAAMAVGILEMVPARVSGVMFSRDPSRPASGEILVHAVPGLGVALVDGSLSPEAVRISRAPALRVTSRAGPEARPSLSDEQALALARWALVLESHFGCPQDVEWAIDEGARPFVLQSRPLRVYEGLVDGASRPVPGRRVLVQGGDPACPGVGAGPVVPIDEDSDLESFPEGGVAVARRPSPKYVRIMKKARAIVTDGGSTTGHMASLARELRVPALLNAKIATRVLRAGAVVTVDALHGLVYDGEVTELLTERAAPSLGPGAPARARRPLQPLLEQVGSLILPLNLTDPREPSFCAEQCATLHDIARYVHEKSYIEMFGLGEQLGDFRGSSYLLDVFLPIDLYVIDLGGGLREEPRRRKVKLAQVASTPLRALLVGMLDRRIPRFGPRPLDVRGFLGVVMRHAMTSPERERTFRDPCYAMVSDRYMNFTARVGYHFGAIDTYCGKTANKNYVSFRFKGGAADAVRRARRARAIAGILREHGFAVDVQGDVVSARFTKAGEQETTQKLEVVGRLFQFMRQMDVAMSTEGAVAYVREAFLKGNYSLAPDFVADENGG
jgi:pyruvate,water dikinase